MARRPRASTGCWSSGPTATTRASFPQTVGPAGQHGFSTRIAVLDEVYLEVGEMKG